MAAFALEMHANFKLPEFDMWLLAIPKCGFRTELEERRQLAIEAVLDNRHDAAFRHLEWMMLRRDEHKRFASIEHDLNRGRNLLKAAARGGEAAKIWPSRSEELQAVVDQIFAENPERSYEEIKRTAAKRKGYPMSALKRYTSNPKKKIVSSTPPLN